MKLHQGELLAEIILFCKGQPLPRGRAYKGVMTQDLENQQEMLTQLEAYSHIQIDIPIIVVVDCGYKKFRWGGRIIKHDVDNVLKGVLDNLQRMFVIKNDSLVIGASCVKHPATEDYVHIRIYKATNIKSSTSTISKKSS